MKENPPNLPEEAIKLSKDKEPYEVWIEIAKLYGSEVVVEYLEINKLLEGEK